LDRDSVNAREKLSKTENKSRLDALRKTLKI